MTTIAWIIGAVLNSLWQAGALSLVVWLVLAGLRERVNAATRHIIWWITLCVVIGLPWMPRIDRSETAALSPPPPAIVRSLPVPVAPPLVAPIPGAPVTVTHRRGVLWPAGLFAVWLGILMIRTTRLVRGYAILRGVKRRASTGAFVLPAIGRSTRVLLSPEISSPIAVGFLDPAVILPADLAGKLTPGELDHVLFHESAHIARYDDWLNLAAKMLDAVFALHPVAWWTLHRIEREREIACDDWVVAQSGGAHSYAESLTRVAELRMQPAHSLLAPGIFSHRSRLRTRIEILLRGGRAFSTSTARIPLVTCAVLAAAFAIAGAIAPRWIAFAQRLEFEVASVKRNTTDGQMDVTPRRSGDLFIMHNVQPAMAIFYAWHLRGAYQLVGYPDFPDPWRWFDIDARVGRDATDDEVRLMMQSLLQDRFKLKVHHETRDIPEYQLVMGKGKPKLTPSDSKEPMKVTIENKTFPVPSGRCFTTLWNDGAHAVCHAAPIEEIVRTVASSMRAPVVDGTGITGTYDARFHFVPAGAKPGLYDTPEEPGPRLEQAIQEELGLKLEKGKGPVEVLVIDHIEKPVEN